MRTKLIAPDRTVFGKCCVRISLQSAIAELTEHNIVLVGDTDGVTYRIHGAGAGWVLQFSLPIDATGRFTVSLVGWVDVPREEVSDDGTVTVINEQVAIGERPPVVIDYDTHRFVDAEFGEPVKKPKRGLCYPITLSDPVVGFTKKHLSVVFSDGKGRCQLSGEGTDYELTVQLPRVGGTLTITPAQSVEKSNGIVLPIAFDTVEMEYAG